MSEVVGVTARLGDAPTIAGSVADPPTQPGSQPQLCGALLGARAHVCAFFRDINEEARALLPFIKAGLAANLARIAATNCRNGRWGGWGWSNLGEPAA